MKNLVSTLLVVLIGFAATGCATGRYLGANPFPGEAGQLMAGNLGMTCPGDFFIGPPINRCLQSLGGDISRYSNHPIYRGGVGGPQLSSADKLAVFCGLGGSGVAMLLDASLKKIIGAGILSAASCEVAGAIANRRGRNQNSPQPVLVNGQYGTYDPSVGPPVQGPPSPSRSIPTRGAFSEDSERTVLIKQLYGKCWTRPQLLSQIDKYDLTTRDIKDISRGTTYINMWDTELLLTAKDGSLDQCLIPAGEERIFILPAGNAGVNALVRPDNSLPITGDKMAWKSLGGSEGWIIAPKCDGPPCR